MDWCFVNFNMNTRGVLLSIFKFCLDAVILYSVALVFYFIYLYERVEGFNLGELFLSFDDFLVITSIGSFVILLVMMLMGVYRAIDRRSVFREIGIIIFSVTVGMAVNVSILFFLLKFYDFRFTFVAFWVGSIIAIIFGKLLILLIGKILVNRFGVGRQNVLLVGDVVSVAQARQMILKEEGKRVSIVGEIPVARLSSIENIHKRYNLDRIMLVDDDQDKQEIIQLVGFCEVNNIGFEYIPYLFDALLSKIDVYLVNGVPLLFLGTHRLNGWGAVAKRCMDVLVSFVALILLMPVFLIVGLVIKWESSGGVLVRLPRVSGSKVFGLYKFRSMVEGSEDMKKYLGSHNERNDGPLFKINNDPRITKVGNFIRKYHIDELPEFFNVLKGDMSLVGPRPHEPEEVGRYSVSHRKTLVIKAGMTGVAQINGSHNLRFEEEVWLDRYYIENWSVWLDFMTLIKTVWAVFNRAKGA